MSCMRLLNIYIGVYLVKGMKINNHLFIFLESPIISDILSFFFIYFLKPLYSVGFSYLQGQV